MNGATITFMRYFLVIGNDAVTEPFHLNGLPNAGRMDILCRCTAQSLFLSHGIRRDVVVYLVLKGLPGPTKIIKIRGDEVRSMAPDERNIGGLIRKALGMDVDYYWKKSSPGIYIAQRNFPSLLEDISHKIVYLREDGKDVREVAPLLKDCLFILGDHRGVVKDTEELILEKSSFLISLSPLSLQADQCITLLNSELDRLG